MFFGKMALGISIHRPGDVNQRKKQGSVGESITRLRVPFISSVLLQNSEKRIGTRGKEASLDIRRGKVAPGKRALACGKPGLDDLKIPKTHRIATLEFCDGSRQIP